MSDTQSATAIETRIEAFPTAQVPGAATLAEVMEAWKARGLTPVQVTSDELLQSITITHNALTGELKWTVSKADGLQAVAVMFAALVDMGEQFFAAKARPVLTSGKARAALSLDGNDVQMAAEPMTDPTVVRGLLVAGLLHLIEHRADPLEMLSGVMRFEVRPDGSG